MLLGSARYQVHGHEGMLQRKPCSIMAETERALVLHTCTELQTSAGEEGWPLLADDLLYHALL